MPRKTLSPRLALIGAASLALLPFAGTADSHENVQNETVKERMLLMKEIAGATKVLGEMAQGKTAFDADEALAAQGKLRAAAAEIDNTFRAPETDPKSEALPAIWENFGDFTEKAAALETAATGMDATSLDNLRAGMRDVGGACGACHKLYKAD